MLVGMLSEVGMLECKAMVTLMDPKLKLLHDRGALGRPRRYRRLVGKLTYLIMTRPDMHIQLVL